MESQCPSSNAFLGDTSPAHGELPARHLSFSAASTKKRHDEILQNPVLYEDYPDNDICVGPDSAYYFSASKFQTTAPARPSCSRLTSSTWSLSGSRCRASTLATPTT
ncbi:hypothetical protein LZ32DRAFT_692213 [Colletotrichum eremochloae]|nr:hypothetical protein LZ32DRAFT_692213 [Colletotrichum eremochloae]